MSESLGCLFADKGYLSQTLTRPPLHTAGALSDPPQAQYGEPVALVAR